MSTDTGAPGFEPRRVVALTGGTNADAVAELAVGRGWPLVGDIPRGHAIPRVLVWSVSPATHLRYVEEHRTGTRRLELSGADPTVLAELDDWLRARVDHHDEAALLARVVATEDPVELIRALPVLAIFEPAAEGPVYLAAYRRALDHPLRAVRRMAVLSAVARVRDGSWPGLRALLNERRAVEPDPNVAAILARRPGETW